MIGIIVGASFFVGMLVGLVWLTHDEELRALCRR